MQPVSPGITGEIHIGGASVADGYLGRPEETASRFLPDPFGGPGDALYRTGDLARWTADGEIEFIGRADAQVKIRGHRIELDDISAALRAHPGVRAAAVVTAQRQGETVLVAYAVANGDEEAVSSWRSHLAGRLPAYMLPHALVCVDALPMTVNGKLDVKALPAPDFAAKAETSTPPRDALDATLSTCGATCSDGNTRHRPQISSLPAAIPCRHCACAPASSACSDSIFPWRRSTAPRRCAPLRTTSAPERP